MFWIAQDCCIRSPSLKSELGPYLPPPPPNMTQRFSLREDALGKLLVKGLQTEIREHHISVNIMKRGDTWCFFIYTALKFSTLWIICVVSSLGTQTEEGRRGLKVKSINRKVAPWLHTCFCDPKSITLHVELISDILLANDVVLGRTRAWFSHMWEQSPKLSQCHSASEAVTALWSNSRKEDGCIPRELDWIFFLAYFIVNIAFHIFSISKIDNVLLKFGVH